MIAAIDFGASATKAAVLGADGQAASVLIDGAPESSSAVFLQPRGGGLVCGNAALGAARRRPLLLQAALKRRINRPDIVEPVHQEVEFGSTHRSRPLVRCVGTVLGHAWRAVLARTGGVEVPLLLTHPVAWGEPQRATLLEAARAAGIPVAGLLNEAEAIGWQVCAARPALRSLLVADVGASTLDIAVLDVTAPDRLRVRHRDGDNFLGGDDFDHEVLDLVRTTLSDDPRDAAQLAEFVDLCATLPHLAAREAERVKRAAAEEGTAVFAHGEIAVDVDCDDLYDATAHLVDRIVRRVRRAMGGAAPPEAMIVTGGAARLPSIRDALAEAARDAGIDQLDWADLGLPDCTTTAVALGAARRPRPWSGTSAQPRRPVTLRPSAVTIAPERVVAVPGGLVGIEPAARPPRTHGSAGRAPALVVRRRPDDPDGDVLLRRPYGVAGLGYDPADNRLATMGHDGSACVWQLDGHRPLLAHHAFWAGPARPDDTAHLDDTANPIGAVAARGGRIAWAAADGTVRLGPPGRPPARPGCPVGRLAFLPDQRLLAAGGDRVVLIDPVTARIADTVQLAGLAEQPTCALAGEDWLVFTADDKDLRCHDCSRGRFETLWERDTFAVPALAVIRLEERPVLVVYDATDRVYRALDARSGVQLALKDADRAAAPAELLADGRTGTVYARHTSDRGRFSVLEFAGEQP